MVPHCAFVTFRRSASSSNIIAVLGKSGIVPHKIAILYIVGVSDSERILYILATRNNVTDAIHNLIILPIAPQGFDFQNFKFFICPLCAEKGIKFVIG